MSYKAEVKTGSDPKFYGNGLSFATEAEAMAYAIDLSSRWMAVTDYRVIESTEPVTYAIKANVLEPVQA